MIIGDNWGSMGAHWGSFEMIGAHLGLIGDHLGLGLIGNDWDSFRDDWG